MEFSYKVHFSKLGWTEKRDNCSVTASRCNPIEAVQINCDSLAYIIVKTSEEYFCGGSNKVVGSIGESKSLLSMCLVELSNSMFHLFYRVSFGDEWSDFHKAGEFTNVNNEKPITGIQLLYAKDIDPNKIEDLNRQLFLYYQIYNKFYVDNKEEMIINQTNSYVTNEFPKVKIVKNGTILPLKINSEVKTRNVCYKGGVVDENNNFVTGHDRKNGRDTNLSCMSAYKTDHVDMSDEAVIYGGILFGFFGHFITETLCRLWWVLEHPENKEKIVFIKAPKTGNITIDLLTKMGIEKDRILLLEKPTRFKSIMIPEQTIRLLTDVNIKYPSIYEHIASKNDSKIKCYEKIYLTRTHLVKNDGINEEFLEQFFSKRDYKVIALEEYDINEQISLLNNANEIICTLGTLSHMILFCKPGTKVTIFRRHNKGTLIAQTLIEQIKKLDIYYVDATYNFLPTKHAGGVFLYGPTKNFKQYLHDQEIEYDSEELEFDIKNYISQYVLKWCDNYNISKNFNEISKNSIGDVLKCMNKVFKNIDK